MSKQEILKNIEELKEQIFMVNMIDRWSSEDRTLYNELNSKLNKLTKELDKIEHPEKFAPLTEEEREALKERYKELYYEDLMVLPKARYTMDYKDWFNRQTEVTREMHEIYDRLYA